MRVFLNFVVFLLPPVKGKNTLLRWLGHEIGPCVRVAPCFVLRVEKFHLSENSYIGPGNTFRDMKLIRLHEHAIIGTWNWVSASSLLYDRDPTGGHLELRENAHITSRHYLDCSGGVLMDEYAALGGVRSVLLTHQMSYRTGRQTTAGITIGAYTLVSSCNNFAPGTEVPARCITGMGSVLTPKLSAEGRLYAGVPARDLRAVDGGWFERAVGRVV